MTVRFFRDLCGWINGYVGEECTDKKSYMDKELNLFFKLSRLLLSAGVSLFQFLDYYNLLSVLFIDGDGMYSSVFVVNFGSVEMDPGYHYFYEWGMCFLFMMVGKLVECVVVWDGQVVVVKQLYIRWSYDEWIDDGMMSKIGIDVVVRVLENFDDYFLFDELLQAKFVAD